VGPRSLIKGRSVSTEPKNKPRRKVDRPIILSAPIRHENHHNPNKPSRQAESATRPTNVLNRETTTRFSIKTAFEKNTA
jgi:hypothetical protein